MCRRPVNLLFAFLFFTSPLAPKTLLADELPFYGAGGYFYDIDQQFIDSFIGFNSLNHSIAITSTAALVNYDIDYHYYSFFEQNKMLQIIAFPPVFIGMFVPISLPLYLHYTGLRDNNQQRLYTAYAVGQSAILSIAITSLYKSVTGRLEPSFFRDERTLEQSKQFDFGFWNNGIFHGWPSGHATTAMAIASSLTELYPQKTGAHAWWILGALYISFGVSTNIHWLSDAIAGSLIGYGIGKSVGRAYYTKLHGRTRKDLQIMPMASANSVGVIFSRRF